MLSHTKSAIVNRGMPIDKVVIVYRFIVFKDYFKSFYGLNLEYLKILFNRFEYQRDVNTWNYNVPISNELLLRTLNKHNLMRLPPFKELVTLKNYILLKHVFIKSYKGYRIMKLRPIHSQRTWSNSKTTRKMNKFVRQFIKKAWKNEKKVTLKQARARRLLLNPPKLQKIVTTVVSKNLV